MLPQAAAADHGAGMSPETADIPPAAPILPPVPGVRQAGLI
jgi:hypothetical protein